MMGALQLEQRACACGCGMEFRVLPSSPQRYAGEFHKEFTRLTRPPSSGQSERPVPLPNGCRNPVSAGKLAKLLGINAGTIYQWASKGQIPSVQNRSGTGNRVRFDAAEVRAAIIRNGLGTRIKKWR